MFIAPATSLQNSSVVDMFAEIAEGSFKLIEVSPEQPLASSNETKYSPALNPVACGELSDGI